MPLEPARVILDGVKQTTDIAKGMRKKLGRARAKKFYAKRGIFDSTTFESIDFDALKLVLNNKQTCIISGTASNALASAGQENG